jgi:preprotein translocase subunit SecA
VEYQREGYDMFNAMLDGIKEESVGFLFNLEVKTKAEQDAEAKAKQDEAEAKALAAAQEGTARVLARQAAEAKVKAAEAEAAHAAHTHTHTAPAPAGAPTARRSGTARKSQPAAATAAPTTAAPAVQTPSPSGTGPELAVKGLDEVRPPENLTYSAPSLDASPKDAGRAKAAKTATVSGTKETPRNAPCPCGSGKKFKQCHGAAGA